MIFQKEQRIHVIIYYLSGIIIFSKFVYFSTFTGNIFKDIYILYLKCYKYYNHLNLVQIWSLLHHMNEPWIRTMTLSSFMLHIHYTVVWSDIIRYMILNISLRWVLITDKRTLPTLKFEKWASTAKHKFTSELLALSLFVPRSDRRASLLPGHSLGEWWVRNLHDHSCVSPEWKPWYIRNWGSIFICGILINCYGLPLLQLLQTVWSPSPVWLCCEQAWGRPSPLLSWHAEVREQQTTIFLSLTFFWNIKKIDVETN